MRSLLLVPLIALLLQTPNCPDYTKEGRKGRPPWVGPTPPTDRAMFTEQEPVPQPLTCGGVLYLDTYLTEKPVQCEGYDYRPQLDRALALRDSRLASLQCPPECPRRDAWVFSRLRSCSSGSATVSMRTAVVCRGVEAPAAPAGLPLPPSGAWRGDEHETKDLPGGQNWRQEVRDYGPRAVACADPPEVVRYDAAYLDRNCSTIPTFKPYVDDAVARAAEYDALLQCGAGCTKQVPFSADYVTWECARAGKDVVVKVYWTPCR